jgi:hydrogenase maturation protein HypF
VVRGGEVLESGLTGSERVGGLSTFRLPGGEAAVRRPARTLAALLDDRERATELLCGRGMDEREAATVRAQAERGTNAPPTTSAGRFLDAAAALLGVCTERTYQGEPAVRLEAVAGRGDPVEIEPPVERVDGETVFRADRGMSRLAGLAETVSRADAAATAQAMLAEGLGACAVAAAERAGVEAVGFTGGVAYNPAITARLRERVTDAGFDFLHHDRVPPGDAGLAYGQAVTAAARLAEG